MFRIIFYFQKIASSDHFIQCTNTKFCHIFTQFLSNKTHEVYNIFRFSTETFSKFRILCCNTYRTGIQVADSHHNTSHGYKRSSSKTEFFCTEKGSDGNITAAHKLTVRFDYNAVTKSVHKQCLVCFCKTEFPWKTCIVNGTLRSSTGTTVITGNQDYLCTGFCNTGCYGTNTCFRNKFYRDSCIFVCVFQVVDQLCQIFDGINIVVWRRGNQTYTRGRMSGFCNPWVNFFSRQMTTLTWFCTLCHFNLDFFCAYKITAGNTKSSGSYLFDCRTSVYFRSCTVKTFVTFTTFTSTGFSVKHVHGNGQCFMSFL